MGVPTTDGAMSNSLHVVDELFDFVWPVRGFDAERIKLNMEFLYCFWNTFTLFIFEIFLKESKWLMWNGQILFLKMSIKAFTHDVEKWPNLF